jgi:hypothetical protein
MKILSLGDTHGSEMTLKIANKYKNYVDHIVFHGDYCDSFYSEWPKQKEVLNDIISFKKDYKNVSLLLGNHDMQYLSFSRCSGNQFHFVEEINQFLNNNIEHFKIVEQFDNYLFSHAGVSKEWMKLKGFDSIESINEAFYNKNFKVFNYIGPDIYGDNYNEGVLWIRPRSLLFNMVEGFNQIVGHTEVGFEKLEQRIFNLELLSKEEPSICDYFDKDKMDLQVVLIDSKQRNIFCITDTEQKTVELFEEI